MVIFLKQLLGAISVGSSSLVISTIGFTSTLKAVAQQWSKDT
jgi:hypothetical protein